MIDALPQPQFTPETGWSEFQLPQVPGFQPLFVSGDPDGDRIRVRYYIRGSDLRLVGKAWFGVHAVGPPGHAHGGSISALLDEAMGLSAWAQGHMVVAARLTINFREMLPLGKEVYIEAGVANVSGRKVSTEGHLRGFCGTNYGDAEGLFLTIQPEVFVRRMAAREADLT